MKFAEGQPVPRREDPVLVQGQGRYTDDLGFPDQLYAVMVRSPYAHGVIREIDVAAARDMPGIVAVYTAADLAEYGAFMNAMSLTGRGGAPMIKAERRALATDRVRFVGDPVACVVGASISEARDAAEAVGLEIDALPAVTDPEAALAPGAEQLYEAAPGNLVLDYQYGQAEEVEQAFAAAAHVTRVPLADNRIIVNPMEPRSAVGCYDAESGRWTLHVGSQGVFGLRNTIAKDILGVPHEKLRVVTGHVGGSFGMKMPPFPEYVCLLHAARMLGRPVKWTDQRSESFMSDSHGRAIDVTGELALDAEGRFLAVRISGVADMGAYLTQVSPLFSTVNIAKNVVGVYRTPLVDVSIRCAYTNTSPVGAYRGAGRPEGNYYMERLIEAAAAELGRDSLELRRLNHIRPEEMPYSTPVETNYDSGEFTAMLDHALKAADWDGFAARRAQSRARGRLRGRGIGHYLEVTAPPMNEMGGIRFEADGTVTIITGTLDYGQGHWTPFAQILSARLGVPFEKITLLQGDSDELIAGGGTGGSKSLMASGAAIVEASAIVIEKGRRIAAELLETGIGDIEFERGRFEVVGTDRGIDIMALAERLRGGIHLPEGVPDTLDVAHVHQSAPSAYPNGCHIAEVEIDPETGIAEVVRYLMVNDFGTIINPLMVEGQLHGGVVQGVGQALMEHTVYDSEGQLVTGSFTDYQLPRAENMPAMVFESRPVPARTNLLGAKGCGEAGCAGALPSVMNAVMDALREVGVDHIDMPATPQRLWQAIREAQDRRPSRAA